MGLATHPATYLSYLPYLPLLERHLESELIEALNDMAGSKLRHPVVVHDIDVVCAGLVEAIVLAVLIPAVVVRLVVVDSDTGFVLRS